MYVNRADKKAGSDVGIGKYDEVTKYANAIMIDEDNDNKIDAIIVDENNDILDKASAPYTVAPPTVAAVVTNSKAYAGTFTATASATSAVADEAITVTVKATADAATTADGATCTIAVTGGGTAAVVTPASVSFNKDELKAGATKTFTVKIDTAASSNITAITITPSLT